MSNQEEREFIVIADEQRFPLLSVLSAQLEQAGARVTSELDFLSQVVIRCEQERITELVKIEGVLRIEPSGQVDLPPFGPL